MSRLNPDFYSQTVIGIFLVPLPLFFASTVYGVRGFTAWVVIGIIWVFCAIATVVITPVYESRESLSQIGRGIVKVRSSVKINHLKVTDCAS